ncbi:hypothetical protein [Alicyclobacillus acidiphilus]|uniref:hypothetical protein n=1 Tax=Alicyclobacillus acidiphilus TaxID=182455 RepID=UPI00082D17B6|nr:hypothetical protein [Alicyclobacillus acidiphilus]
MRPMKRIGGLTAAAVLVAAAGAVVWNVKANFHHPALTRAAAAVNPTSQPKLQKNRVTSHAASASTSAEYLPQYTSDKLVPAKPLPVVAPKLNGNGPGQLVPVVRVPVTVAISEQLSMSAPKAVYAQVSVGDAKRLAAYLVPVDPNTWMYILAPRGMTGKVELAADGSGVVELKSSDASIGLSFSGGSPISAAALGEPFFARARKDLVSDQVGSHPPNHNLPNTSVQYFDNNRLAVFAFASTKGQSVYGYDYYGLNSSDAGPLCQGALFSYAAKGSAKKLASDVMASAIATLDEIGEPNLQGPVVPTISQSATVSGRKVSLLEPKLAGFTPQVEAANAGIVWLSQPRVIAVDPEAPHGVIPEYAYYLNVTSGPVAAGAKLNTVESQTLTAIPAYQLGDSVNNPMYNSVRLIGVTGSNWVLYEVTASPLDANSGESNLYAIDASKPNSKPILITPFMDGGGGFFYVGYVGTTVVYDVANDLNPNGNIVHHIAMLNLATGVRTSVPSTALKNGVVTVQIDGVTEQVALHEE